MEHFNYNGDSYSGSVVWLTPQWIIDALGEPFDLDPCACEDFPLRTAKNCFDKTKNGLIQNWSSFKDIYINPPYDYISLREYTKKAIEHKDCIMLIYARVDTELFHDYIFPKAYSILFIKGRLKFLDYKGIESKNSAGAPSCLIAFSKDISKRLEKALNENKIKGRLIILNKN